MKQGIIHFNASVGIVNGPDSGYHEILTRFWLHTISCVIQRHTFASTLEGAREAVKLFGEDRDLHNLYYSFDVVRTRDARHEWIPPDREPSWEWYADEPAA